MTIISYETGYISLPLASHLLAKVPIQRKETEKEGLTFPRTSKRQYDTDNVRFVCRRLLPASVESHRFPLYIEGVTSALYSFSLAA